MKNRMIATKKILTSFKDEIKNAEIEHEAVDERIGKTNEYLETQPKVQIPLSALIQRLNSNFMDTLRQLRKSRGAHTRVTLGDYYNPNVAHDFVVKACTTVDRMEEIARQLGILQNWEVVVK